MHPNKLKILVTGAKGFVGKNLCAQLNVIKDGKDRRFPDLGIDDVMEYDIEFNSSTNISPLILLRRDWISRKTPFTVNVNNEAIRL